MGNITKMKNSTAPSISFLEEYIVFDSTKIKLNTNKVSKLNPKMLLKKAKNNIAKSRDVPTTKGAIPIRKFLTISLFPTSTLPSLRVSPCSRGINCIFPTYTNKNFAIIA